MEPIFSSHGLMGMLPRYAGQEFLQVGQFWIRMELPLVPVALTMKHGHTLRGEATAILWYGIIGMECKGLGSRPKGLC